MTKSKRVLVTGSTGQLGLSLKMIASRYPLFDLVFVGREVFDMSNDSNISSYFQHQNYDIIINCAAYTAVDSAETEVALAEQINHLAVKKLAEVALDKQIKLIHISTDYVFNGLNFRPYSETDMVSPQNQYGISKMKGEQALLETLSENGLIIRTSWLYSEFGNNFVKTMGRLGLERSNLNIIYDQVSSPTYAGDLAVAIMTILESDEFECANFTSDLYHYSNEGVCSWYDFAQAIFEYSHIDCIVNPIETTEYPTPAQRPNYTVLNKTKIKSKLNLSIPYWRNSLRTCLTNLQEKTK